MAIDLSATLSVGIKGADGLDKLSSALGKASTSMAQAGKSADQMRAPIQVLSSSVDAAKGALGELAVAAGSFVALKAASQHAIEFEAAMIDVDKVANLNAGQFAALQKELRGMSEQMPLTATELAAIAEAGGSLGIVADNLPQFTKLAAEMAVGFKMSADEAGTAVGKLSNIFTLSIPQARLLANAINTLGDNTSATEKQIVDVLQRTGGMGKQFGLSAEQTAALGDAFIQLGDSPEVAATAINNLLSRLQSAPVQTAGFQATLRELGFDASKMGSMIESDAQGTLTKFLDTISKLDGKTKTVAIGTMFGTGGDAAAIAKMTGSLGKYKEALDLVKDTSKGDVAGAMAKQMEGAGSQLKTLGNAVTNIGLSLGVALLPVIKAFATGAQAVASFTAKVVETAPATVSVVTAVASGVVAISAISKAVGLASGLMGAMGIAGGTAAAGATAAGVASAGAATGVSILGTAVKGLMGPIGLVAAGATALGAAWEWAKGKMKEQDDQMNELATGAVTVKKAAAAEEVATAQDKAADLAKLSEQGQAAEKARLEAGVKLREMTATLVADANKREIDRLRRALDAETATLGEYYGKKKAAAAQDVDNQIAQKRAERAALAGAALASEADRIKQRADIEKLNADITILTRTRADSIAAIEREQAQEQLAITEAAEKARAGVMSRGLDRLMASTKLAQASGLATASDVAAAEAAIAETKAGDEIASAERVLAAKRKAGATAQEIRQAEADLDDKLTARQVAHADVIAAAAEKIKGMRDATASMRLAIDADPAMQTVAEAGRQIQALQTSTEAEKIRLEVTMSGAGPAEADAIRQQIIDIEQAQADQIEAINAGLEEKLKPQWLKQVEAWKDSRRLMRDASDEAMQGIVKNSEDAFVEFANTGKLSTQKIIDDLKNQWLRAQFKKLIGGALGGDGEQGGQGGGLLRSISAGMGALFGVSKPGAAAGPANPVGAVAAAGLPSAAGSAANPVAQAADTAATSLKTLTDASTSQGEASTLLTTVQQTMQATDEASTATETAATGELAVSMQAAAMAAQQAAMGMEQAAISAQMGGGGGGGAGGVMELAAMFAADGAIIPYAKGGSFGVTPFAKGGGFTNTIVSSPTMFAFAKGGRLGVMGEAGPEAIVPLSRGGSAVDAVDGGGRKVGEMQLARGAGGRLSVRMPDQIPGAAGGPGGKGGDGGAATAYASGGTFSPSISVAPFAAGGTFGGGTQSTIRPFAAGGAFDPSGYNQPEQQPGGSGAVNISQTFNITTAGGGGMTPADIQQLTQTIKAQTIAAVNDAQRRARR